LASSKSRGSRRRRDPRTAKPCPALITGAGAVRCHAPRDKGHGALVTWQKIPISLALLRHECQALDGNPKNQEETP
jgi:hypothetical protein